MVVVAVEYLQRTPIHRTGAVDRRIMSAASSPSAKSRLSGSSGQDKHARLRSLKAISTIWDDQAVACGCSLQR